MQAGASVKGEFENRLKNGHRRGQESPGSRSSFHRRSPHPDRRRRAVRPRTTPPTCSNRRSPAANCAPSPPPPGPNTRNTSRRMPALARRFQVVKVEEPSETLEVLSIPFVVVCLALANA
ncbi:MAG: hypothetical protein MZV70_63320 [Desulfobacterales bacterium]|nr:hypothetical protein [Desulfobacterales bacterium]